MLELNAVTQEYQEMIATIANHLQAKGYTNIRANSDDFEKPAKLVKKEDDDSFRPDLTAVSSYGKCYFEIATKAGKNKSRLIEKWTMISALAEHRKGQFIVVVPNGNLSYTRKLLQENNHINAEVIRMKTMG